MRYFFAFAVLGLYVVFLSTLEPDVGRWFAIGLLVFMFSTPAVGRYASAGRSSGEAVSHRGERGD